MPAMTWRRFLVLVRGLSPHSATVAAIRARADFGPAGEGVNAITSPKAADQAFVAMFGGGRERPPEPPA